jgi:hypothetical protein
MDLGFQCEQEVNVGEHIQKGWQFLKTEGQEGFFPSYVSSARDAISLLRAPREVFSSIVIADALPKNEQGEHAKKLRCNTSKGRPCKGN